MSPTSHARKRPRLGVLNLFAVAFVSALLVLAPATSASATTTTVSGVRLNAAEARLLRLVNAHRIRAGAPALRIAAGYTDVARRWSRAMAARRTLVHNPRLAAQVSSAGGASWRAIGENVAYGYGPDTVFALFMRSAPHRANILSGRYRFIGVGWVETSGGPGYATLVFSSSYSTSYGPTRVAPAPCRLYH